VAEWVGEARAKLYRSLLSIKHRTIIKILHQIAGISIHSSCVGALNDLHFCY